MSGEFIDPDFYEVVEAAVFETHGRLAAEPETFFPTISTWKKIEFFESSGMPNFTWSPSNAPRNYCSVVGWEGGLYTKITYEELPTIGALIEYGRSSPVMTDRFAAPDSFDDDMAQRMFDHQVAHVAFEIVDRMLHLNLEPSEDVICDLYRALERNLLGDDRPVEVLAPILCTAVEAETRFDLAAGIWVEPMDELTQLARERQPTFGPVQDVLLGAATHAVVVEGGSMPYVGLSSGNQQPHLPTDRIDAAFQALRIAGHSAYGYGQLVLRPIGWASHWTAHLPPLQPGPVMRRYASNLDDYGWLRAPMALTAEELGLSGKVLQSLVEAPAKVKLGARRLARASLRDDDEDQIIDSCVGIEALLSDGTPAELTHKLALRAAAVLAAQDGSSPEVMFRWVKKIYAFRSAVVHGQANLAKVRSMEIDGEKYSTVSVARILLQRLLLAVLERPELQDPEYIDQELLLRGLSTVPVAQERDPSPATSDGT